MGKYLHQNKLDSFEYDVKTGWCHGAKRIPSPNQNDRPASAEPQLIVIHNISLPPKQFEGEFVEAFFCNKLDASEHPYFHEIASLEVSSHFYIRRSGNCIQFVSCQHRAWHAGRSTFMGRDNCNDFSIGIEMEGADDIPYTASQYQMLANLILLLRKQISSLKHCPIVGHSDIAPGRKTDPGNAFDWLRLQTLLKVQGQ